MKKIRMRKILKIVWFTVAGIVVVWNWWTFQSRGLPKGIFKDNENVSVVESNDDITFKSLQADLSLEIIFFQGGMTDPKALVSIRQLNK